MNIFKNKQSVLQGKRNKTDALWGVPLTPMITNNEYSINFIVHKNKSELELAQYLHACARSLVISTFQKAINNENFITWQRIDKINYNALLKTTLATAKGRLDQERINL